MTCTDAIIHFQPSVEGMKCAACLQGTFGLSKANPEGCFHCFCFGRADTCSQTDYAWTQLAFSGGRNLVVSRGQSELALSNGLLVVPGEKGDVKIGVESIFTTPLYWSAPAIFLGDKILSYNGYLRFSLKSNGPRPYSPGVLQEYPLVQLLGNHKIVLEHYPKKASSVNVFGFG
jgi:hypothetical protein